MANVLAPFGFNPINNEGESATNFGAQALRLAYNNTNKIFRGDTVIQLNTGYIDVGAAGDGAITVGIFWGCKYYSVSGKIPKLSPWWPGSDAPEGQDVIAYVITDKKRRFMVQAAGNSAAAIPFSAVGQNSDVNTTTAGNQTTGFSGMALSDTVGTTSSYPFRVVALGSTILQPGVNGADNTTPYNYVIVEWNQALDRAGVTGV